MSSQPKSSLTPSASQSSLLLSTANLSWTPTTGALIVAPPLEPPPQPALSPTPSDQSSIRHDMTHEEIIQSLRRGAPGGTAGSSRRSSISGQALDESFQTISLVDGQPCLPSDDNNTGANSGEQSHQSTVSSLSSAGALNSKHQKMSFIETLFQRTSQVIVSTTTGALGAGIPSDDSVGTGSAPVGGVVSHFEPQLSGAPAVSPPMMMTSVGPTVPAIPVSAPVAPPVLPAQALVSKDFKLRGPLRLYDPNHGATITTATSAAASTLPAPPLPPVPIASGDTPLIPDPYTQPLPVDNLYNPSDYYTPGAPESQPLDLSQPPAYSSAPFDALSPSSGPTTSAPTLPDTASQYSYVSPTQTLDNTYGPDWQSTQQQSPTASPADTTGAQQPYQPYQPYAPVVYHWFYQRVIENKEVWRPFSLYDTYNLEQSVLTAPTYGYGVVIPTDGGRFDVSVGERVRRPVYWQESDTICRRCSWFYRKEGHNRWVPYGEEVSERLEAGYRQSVMTNTWNTRVELDGGQEVVVMHTRESIYHYQLDQSMPDGWGQALENPQRPRLVARGVGALDGMADDIDEGEPVQVDHLVFLIHGIGEICDFRFRSIVEVVDDFRCISLSLMRTHFRSYMESGQLGRIELLPISWHSALHGDETGIDDRLRQITLDSIPKLRHFSNDTILDALFYTSPVYCQTIVDSVGQELNRLFELFCHRNPNFCGTVALGGHSLGSLIVFDILAHQSSDADLNVTPNTDHNSSNASTSTETLTSTPVSAPVVPADTVPMLVDRGVCTSPTGHPYGHQQTLGLGFPDIKYPTLAFRPSALFAMGSPLPMFLTVRGVHYLSPDYRLPTCPAVYNIFHPYDPIAYRLEPMIYRAFKDIKPVLIPHHKGRKRMHLELRDSIARMGSDIKNKIYDSLKYTWNSINEFAKAHRTVGASVGSVGAPTGDYGADGQAFDGTYGSRGIDGMPDAGELDGRGAAEEALSAGALNSGRRIDYVLQESPVEAFNEYLFAMAAHACYWGSEDTALLVLRELYGQLGYYTDRDIFSGSAPPIPTSASQQSLDGQQQPFPAFDDTNLQFVSH